MSFRTSSSKARARESTLPIEDFAKGLTRLMSRKKKRAGVKNSKLEGHQDVSDVPPIPELPIYELSAGPLPRRSASFSTPNTSAMSHAAPIEDWMSEVPQFKPIPARNPNRPSTSSSKISFQRSISIPRHAYNPSPLASPGLGIDQRSEIGTEPPSPAPIYQSQLNHLVDTSSHIRAAPVTVVIPGSPSPSDRSLIEQLDLVDQLELDTAPKEDIAMVAIDLAAAALGVESVSLRSMFFATTNVSEGRRRSLSVASSRSAIPAPLSIGSGSPRPRPISIASSRMSFMTACEYAIEDEDEDEEEFQLAEEQIPVQIERTVTEAIDTTNLSKNGENMDTRQETSLVDDTSANESTNDPLINQRYAAVIRELSTRNSMSLDCYFTTRSLTSPSSAAETPSSHRPISPTASNISMKRDCVADDEQSAHDFGDTGIDEDYTSSEDDEEELHPTTHLASNHGNTLNKDDGVVISTNEIPADSLASILLEVASSSPYASEDSDTEAGIEYEFQDCLDTEDFQSAPVKSNEAQTPFRPRTSSLAPSTTSINRNSLGVRRGIRPARHYKMINGVIVEYEPWRAPGVIDLARYSPPSSKEGSIARGMEGQQQRWSGVTVEV